MNPIWWHNPQNLSLLIDRLIAKQTLAMGLEKFMKNASGHILSACFTISKMGGMIRMA